MSRTFDYPGLRILTVFFEDPHREFHLREAASTAKVSPSTAKIFLDDYVKLNLLTRTDKANLHLFKANLEEPSFRLWKTSRFLLQTGLYLRRLSQAYPNSSLVLFGGCANGTDGPGSDLDLLLITREPTEPPTRLVDELSRRSSRNAELIKYTPEQWESKARADKPFYETILTNGITISGNIPVVAT